MRWVWILAIAVAFAASSVRAADDVKPEQLKKDYDQAVSQLQAAQDRINKLAMDNEKLAAKVAEMQKQLDTAKANETAFAEKTYQYRATFAAWEQFLKRYPNLNGRWQAFLQNDLMSTLRLPDWADVSENLSALIK